MSDRCRRPRGASSVEYIIIVTLVAIGSIALWSQLGSAVKCRVATATGLFGGANAPACSSAGGPSPGLALNGPGQSGNGNDCPNGQCMAPGSCFVAGTPVWTEAGSRPIESIAVGDCVMARDPERPEAPDCKPVLSTSVHTVHGVVRLNVAGAEGGEEVIEATVDHPFYVRDRGWVEAARLVPGHDRLTDADGAPLSLRAAESVDGERLVYNFVVADHHTYFVGAQHILVHNGCGQSKPDPSGRPDVQTPDDANNAKNAGYSWSNGEIRQWYNDQVDPSQNPQWGDISNSPLAEQAQQAYDIRHNARITARAMMGNKLEVWFLNLRDQMKYGNPGGPTFNSLYQSNIAKGMTPDAAYQAIIDSSKRTNADYNARFNVDTAHHTVTDSEGETFSYGPDDPPPTGDTSSTAELLNE